MLELKKVGLIYFSENGETMALKDISFKLNDGEFIAVLGPSGSGKTTILSIISGLMKPTSGRVLLNNEDLKLSDNKTGYMFQKDFLFEWRTVLDNVLLGLEINKKFMKKELKRKNKNIINTFNLKGKTKSLIIKNAKKVFADEYKLNIIYAKNLLKKYGLWDFRNNYPNQLSGGMRQRVALIRTLTLKPEVLLLDEPFSALDYQTRLNLCEDVSNIIKNENKTTILVTHDITEALSMADKVIILSKRPAVVKKIYQINTDDNLTPLQRRESGKFLENFDKIWKELQDEEE